MSKDDITNLAAVIAAVIAVINVLVTIVNIFVISRNQKRSTFANVVSANRIRWIEDLRKDVSQYIGLATAIRRLKASRSDAENYIDPSPFTKEDSRSKTRSILDNIDKDIRDKAEQAVVLQSLLQIKLNVGQKEQLDVWNRIESFPIEGDIDNFTNSINDLTKTTRILLNKEWKRVENLR